MAQRRRFLLGAFGDPGHAFPMIALGRALLARGHEVSLQTWARWREHVRGGGHRLPGRARVPRLPHRRRAAGLLRGGRPGHPGHVAGGQGARARRRGGGHPHARAGAGRGARGGAAGDPHPPRLPPRRRRLPGVLDRRAAAAGSDRPFLLAYGSAAGGEGPRAGPARAERNPRRARPAGARARARRDQPRAGARGHPPPTRVPAGLAALGEGRRSIDVGATVRGGRVAPGGRPAGAGGALDRPGPRAPPAAGLPGGARRASPYGCSPPTTGACHAGPCRCRGTRPSWSGCPTRARCPTASWSSATPATGRSCAPSPTGCPCSRARRLAT